MEQFPWNDPVLGMVSKEGMFPWSNFHRAVLSMEWSPTNVSVQGRKRRYCACGFYSAGRTRFLS
jgi:hypothetical protein